MKNFNLKIKFKDGTVENIYHVDNIYFDKRFPKDMSVHSYGLVTYIKSDSIDYIETFTSNY